MSKVFQDLSLEWLGEQYPVKANRMLRAIGLIEDHVKLYELGSQQYKYTDLAQAYGAVLRFAGCDVSDDEVYAELLHTDGHMTAHDGSQRLLEMALPPEGYQPLVQVDSAKKKKASD